MNHNIKNVLTAIEALRGVKECELEIISLSHKAQAMFDDVVKSEHVGIDFINRLSDEELRLAFEIGDKRLDMYPFPNPRVVNHLRKSGRGWALLIKTI
jgi:hypothetical protein